MKVLGVIPARKGSKRLENKNFANFAGKPLVEWTIEASFESKVFTNIVLSTDSKADLDIFSSWGLLDIGVRPKELSTDSSTSLSVINHVLELAEKKTNVEYDAVVTLQPTSPLRTAEDIKNAFQKFLLNDKSDSLISITEIPHIFYPEKVIKDLTEFIEFEKDSIAKFYKSFYAPNGAAIYITSKEILPHKLIGSNCAHYSMPRWRSIDIDTFEDFLIAELIMKNKNLFNHPSNIL